MAMPMPCVPIVRKTRSIHEYKNLLTNGELSIRLSPIRASRTKGKLDQPAEILFVQVNQTENYKAY